MAWLKAPHLNASTSCGATRAPRSTISPPSRVMIPPQPRRCVWCASPGLTSMVTGCRSSTVIRSNTALIEPIIAAFTDEEREFFDGFVHEAAASVAAELSHYDAHPDYQLEALPDDTAHVG